MFIQSSQESSDKSERVKVGQSGKALAAQSCCCPQALRAEVAGEAVTGGWVVDALGCPQRELAECFGNSDSALCQCRRGLSRPLLPYFAKLHCQNFFQVCFKIFVHVYLFFMLRVKISCFYWSLLKYHSMHAHQHKG